MDTENHASQQSIATVPQGRNDALVSLDYVLKQIEFTGKVVAESPRYTDQEKQAVAHVLTALTESVRPVGDVSG